MPEMISTQSAGRETTKEGDHAFVLKEINHAQVYISLSCCAVAASFSDKSKIN